MKLQWVGVLFLVVFLGFLVWVFRSHALQPVPGLKSLGSNIAIALPTASAEPVSPVQTDDFTMEVVAQGLAIPWSLVFTSTDRLLVTERTGAIRVIQNGQLQAEPLHQFSEVSTGGEEGLMGLALDPAYQQNKYLYVSYAYQTNGQMKVKIVRLTDEGTQLTNPQTILDNLPAAANHAGNRLKFGPDGKLYSSTGDASQRQIAQNKDSLGGKILRLNADGSIPNDNPFPNSPIWSFGHRNPQGLAWHPETGNLYATEHGPSGFDGPGGGDEVNLIQKGQNYGWPTVSHDRNQPGLVAPLAVYTPAVAPASALFYSGEALPAFKNNFFFGALRGEGLYRLRFSPNNPATVELNEKVEEVDVGRVRDVAQGPDGFIYFSTSNTDGRGRARAGDDTIYRLVPRQ